MSLITSYVGDKIELMRKLSLVIQQNVQILVNLTEVNMNDLLCSDASEVV